MYRGRQCLNSSWSTLRPASLVRMSLQILAALCRSAHWMLTSWGCGAPRLVALGGPVVLRCSWFIYYVFVLFVYMHSSLFAAFGQFILLWGGMHGCIAAKLLDCMALISILEWIRKNKVVSMGTVRDRQESGYDRNEGYSWVER